MRTEADLLAENAAQFLTLASADPAVEDEILRGCGGKKTGGLAKPIPQECPSVRTRRF